MSYSIHIEGFEGQNIEAKVSYWTGPKLFINDVPAPKGKKRGEMALQTNTGKPVIASWKPQFLGLDVPKLIVDGKVITLVKPLKWYQWAWAGLPVTLVFVGGALGAFAGLIGFSVNAVIFRKELNIFLKYLLTWIVTVLAMAVYFVLAMLFSMLILR